MIVLRLVELEAIIEALLFISAEAVPLKEISGIINMDKATTKAIIASLRDKYENEMRGLRIIEVDGAYQMCTSPECYEYLYNAYKLPAKQGLSQSLLEILAVVAYKQPVTRGEIEEIRGVNSDYGLNRLLEKKLVCEAGRADSPGKPVLFATTKEFLRYFGLKSPDELPQLKDITEEEIIEERKTLLT